MNIFYPVEKFADLLTFTVFKLTHGSYFAEAVRFFIYDTIKIFIMLAIIIFCVAILRTYFTPVRARVILSHKNRYLGHLLAGLLGIITPFCTCSAIPLFIGFVEVGVPLGVTFSFLVASPMINEIALVMLLGMFGWKVALLYIASGLVIAIVSGIVIGALKTEHLLADFVLKKRAEPTPSLSSKMKWRQRLSYAQNYTLDIIKKVWLYIIIGIGVGAWIHGYIPVGMLAEYAGADKWYAVPLATLIGIPLYSNAAGVIPLVSALTEKGVAMGTTLAFMMAVTGLSLPEFMILKKIMQTKLILLFAGVVGMGIIFTGYLFNLLLK